MSSARAHPLTLLSTELESVLRRPRTEAEPEQTLRSATTDTANLIALADTLLTGGVQAALADGTPDVDLGDLLAGRLDKHRATTDVADMVPENPGGWLFHCHVDDHIAATVTRYQVTG